MIYLENNCLYHDTFPNYWSTDIEKDLRNGYKENWSHIFITNKKEWSIGWERTFRRFRQLEKAGLEWDVAFINRYKWSCKITTVAPYVGKIQIPTIDYAESGELILNNRSFSKLIKSWPNVNNLQQFLLYEEE